jgi:uncharacterized protein (DUF924 family)
MTALPTQFDVLDFWWRAGASRWFAGGDAFDGACRERFLDLLEHAAAGGLADWEATPSGALALIIVLDQLSRNIYRGTPRAFAQDARALAVAERAVAAGFDRAYPMPARQFFYMPFEHSEDMRVQERSCDLFRATGDHDAYYWALVHMDAIRRFGRFPHRNVILGRATTPEEQRYLDSGGFSA